MNIADMTDVAKMAMAIELAEQEGFSWDRLTQEQQAEFLIEATFCFSWLVE